jgi:uncharacterized membrane protein
MVWPRRSTRCRTVVPVAAVAAGRHFNRGQRAFFFALGYLGWFVSPWVLFVTTAAVVIVTWRRQFASNAWRAMGS